MSISTRPQRAVKSSNRSAENDPQAMSAVWKHRDAEGELCEFDPRTVTDGELSEWAPVRAVGGSKLSSNIKVKVWCAVNSSNGQSSSHELESGLEHDLHRRLDRPTVSSRLLPQPFRISLPTAGLHTPDLLQISPLGVTVWDCRSDDDQDGAFLKKSAETADAATSVGWDYRVFTGMSVCERLNLIQLNGFRRPCEWTHKYVDVIRAAAAAGTSMHALFDLDDGSGELKSALWHMIWRGGVAIDLCSQITGASRVCAA